MKPEGPLHRAPRPLILWCGVALVLFSVLGLGAFLFRVGGAIAAAFERSAQTGAPVPDMTGGLPALISALVGLIVGLWPVVQAMNQRHVERRDQIARGGAPPDPFPSAPLSDGGAVNPQINPHGGPDAP